MRANGRDAVRGAWRDRAGAAVTLPTRQRSMWVDGLVDLRSRIEIVAQHVVDEPQEGPEWPRLSVEHMFARVRTASDGSGGPQRKLHALVEGREPGGPARVPHAGGYKADH